MPARRAILVTGGSGQLGGAVARLAAAQGMDVWAPGREALDLTNQHSISAAMAKAPWQAVINCAAYTAVDKAEFEPALAYRINAEAPSIMAEECKKYAVPIIHVSTDYVFDGSKESAYEEHDAVNPISVYGHSKQQGEAAIRAAGPVHAIVRTSWVMSTGHTNFLSTMLRLGSERSELSVVGDQIGCPSSAADIAAGLLHIAQAQYGQSGTWHLVNSGVASWYNLAEHIFNGVARRGLPTPALTQIASADYPTAALRPANSRLSTEKIGRDFNLFPRPWQEAIDAILAERLDRI